MVAGRLKPSRGDSEKWRLWPFFRNRKRSFHPCPRGSCASRFEKHKLSRRSLLKTGVKKVKDNHEKRSSYVLRLNQRGLNIVFRIGAAQEL